MAVNPNTTWSNEHAIAAACSGGGKSQIVGQELIPKGAGHRVLLWDTDEDHKATRFNDRESFAKAVRAALVSGKGFRLAFTGRPTVENFEWFCAVAWACLDGNKRTYVVIEELADVSPTAAKATPNFGELLRKGRKYGAVILMTTQRGAEIAKTAWTQVGFRFIGIQEGDDNKRMAKQAAVREQDILNLQNLEFYCKRQGRAEPEKITLKYKKIN